MLSRTSYSPEYVRTCRDLFEGLLAAYASLPAGSASPAGKAFEAGLARHLIVVLDAYFVHRARGQEKKDGNPLNEVRMLRDSILEQGCVLAENKTIKYRPERAILGLEPGSTIEPRVADVARLADGFFQEIEAKFVRDGD